MKLRHQIRTTQGEWQNLLDQLIDWFKIKQFTQEQNSRFYNRIKYYPIQSIMFAVDKIIDERRPVPGMWPTIDEIINFSQQYLKDKPELKFQMMDYDPVEDPDYPIGKLEDGFRILERSGQEEFIKFAEKNRMPLDDRERVLNKKRMADAKDQKNVVRITNYEGGSIKEAFQELADAAGDAWSDVEDVTSYIRSLREE